MPDRRDTQIRQLKARLVAHLTQKPEVLTVSPEMDKDNVLAILRELVKQFDAFPWIGKHVAELTIGTNNGMTDGQLAVTWDNGTPTSLGMRFRLTHFRGDRAESGDIAREEFGHLLFRVLVGQVNTSGDGWFPKSRSLFAKRFGNVMDYRVHEMFGERYRAKPESLVRWLRQFRQGPLV